MGRNSESIEDASFDISTKSIVHKKKTCLCFTTAKLILIHLQSSLEGDVKGLKSRWIRKKERVLVSDRSRCSSAKEGAAKKTDMLLMLPSMTVVGFIPSTEPGGLFLKPQTAS